MDAKQSMEWNCTTCEPASSPRQLAVLGVGSCEQRSARSPSRTGVFEVGVMVASGIIGCYMRDRDYPVTPLVPGILLGDILDKDLQRALILSHGNVVPFCTRPICAVVAVITILTILSKMRWLTNLGGQARRGLKSFLPRGGGGPT